MTATIGLHPLVEAARAMAPAIRARSGEIEESRRLPQDLVDDLVRAGFMHTLVPAAAGGRQTEPIPAAQVVEELAAADGSTGWCVMLAAQSAAFAGMLPIEEVRTIWGDGGIVAGTARPIGRAVATSSPAPGFEVSGRWPFASGSSHATWFMGECVVYDGETKRLDGEGNEVTRACFVPRSEVTVHDTWRTLGLRGTASNDFSIEGAFVLAARGFQMIADAPIDAWAVYRAPALIFMNHGSHALGVARGALRGALEVATEKRGWGGQPLREMQRIQATIAEATALVESARSFLYATAEELWAAVQATTDDAAPEVVRLRSRVRLAASHAATSSVRAVDLLHGALGATAIFTDNPVEREFRDVHTAAAHVMIGPLTYEAAGRVELGLDAAFPFF